MLLTNYKKEIFRAECKPEFKSVHLKAYLSEDIEKVLPFLNTALGGFAYYKEPPAVTFKNNGRLITVQGNEIAINALKDIVEGVFSTDNCPTLKPEIKTQLNEYLSHFSFED